MNEKTLERKVVKYCREHDMLCLKLSGMNQRGQPDRMILSDGRVLFLELKGHGKKPTKLQLHYLQKLRREGFTATWVDNYDAFLALIVAMHAEPAPNDRSE